VQVSASELARQPGFKDLVAELQAGHHRTLSALQDAVGPGVVRVAASGGGATLPFLAKLLKSRPKGCKMEVRLAPIRPEWVSAPGFRGQLAPIFPQLAVAIGGAAAPESCVLREHQAVTA
jgi:hypothetical protein